MNDIIDGKKVSKQQNFKYKETIKIANCIAVSQKYIGLLLTEAKCAFALKVTKHYGKQ
jgi:hypothetical protein